ncbi:hypothetical protein A1353_21770 [Methylomonas methanica]|uniref:Glycosyltransferase 2-like domain-containing protein n=1 Tax=Methylomonas methanica TaxID=421 RepID=A0A177LZG7_METMH|nr:hypothetical protein [Methylomonas methanica]OAH98855.1 hypothetical protein A1353_21770 [Methylomonas methanica]
MPKPSVTVYLEIFNEEKRIESCLKSFTWAKELVVFDKHSTDQSLEIARKYATEIISLPFTLASENAIRVISTRKSCEWVMFPTASSLIHPLLVREIRKLTEDNSFEYDVISLPYGMHSFGINNKKSPWTASRKNILIRRSALCVSSKLHNEIKYESDKIYEIPFINDEALLYHCTHKDGDDFFNRHMRYTKYEAEYEKHTPRDKALKQAFFEILKSIYVVVFRRRSFLLGWDGIALSLAYISYFIMKFIYTWDIRRDNGNIVYPALQKKIDDLWKNEI